MNLSLLLLLMVIFLVPTLLQIRRQKSRLAELKALQDSLRPGDRIVTTAGVHGQVVGVRDGVVDVEIAPGMITTWEAMAIVRVLPDTTTAAAASVDADSGVAAGAAAGAVAASDAAVDEHTAVDSTQDDQPQEPEDFGGVAEDPNNQPRS